MLVTGLDTLPHHIDIIADKAKSPSEIVLSAAALITRESGIAVPTATYPTSQLFLETRHPRGNTWYTLRDVGAGILGAALVSHDGQMAQIAELAIRSDVQRQVLGSILVRHIAQKAATNYGESDISIPAVIPEFAESLGMQVERGDAFAMTSISQLLSPEQQD